MQLVQLACALGLSWALGIVWLRRSWAAPRAPGFWPMALGYGYILGLCATTLLMRLIDIAGLAQNINTVAVLLALLALAGIRSAADNSATVSSASVPSAPHLRLRPPLWQKALFLLFLLFIVLRFASVAVEVVWLPLFPWDAWTTWAVMPQVWFELKDLVPFVAASQWLADHSTTQYVIDAWHYPATVPLIQLWTALAFGQWNETVNNISWLLCGLALALGFYGQMRLAAIPPLTAIIFTYLLISIPLLDTHIALAGYADLWMATVFGFAAIAGWQYLKSKDPGQAVVALVLCFMCPLIKTEGVIWVLAFVPALIVYLCSRQVLLLSGFLIATALVVGFLAGGIHYELPGLGELIVDPREIKIPYVGDFTLVGDSSLFPFIENLLLLNSWHLLWYLIIVLMLLSLRTIVNSRLLFVYTTMIMTGIGILFVLFFVTEAERWAEAKTSINRIFMHMVPLLLFYAVTLWQARLAPAHRESTDTAALPAAQSA